MNAQQATEKSMRPSAPAGGSVDVPWSPMETAPKDCTVVCVQMRDGTIWEDAHWASDLSGEEQPPFEGWFRPMKDSNDRVSYYAYIGEPVAWRPRPPNGPSSATAGEGGRNV